MIHPEVNFFHQSVKGVKLCPPLELSIVNFQSMLSVTPISILYELSFWFQDIQGCISCGILVSGIRARGVSSEHMENMEMFSCSPT